MTTKPLAGVRVLDLTNVLAGPFAGYQLALMGADVIKIEVPGSGDLARQLGADKTLSEQRLGVSFLAQNAGKRSVTLNLKHPDGAEVFRTLVTDADVVLENFRPGVMDRLGFGWEELHTLNPALIYCAVSGFGSSGPLRQRAAYDQIVQGLSGVMSVTGTEGTAPLRVGFPVCDSFGGLAAAFAISSALVDQQRTGEGRYLDVSMLDAAMTAMGWVVSDHLVAGIEPVPMGNENRTSAPSGTFETADGQLNIAANKQEQFEILCRTIGREELIDDERFRTREDRKAHRAQLKAELEVTLTTQPAEAWDALFAPTGVPAAPVVTVGEALRSPQVEHRGLLHELPSPSGDRTLQVLGSSAWMNGAPLGPDSPPPLLGEHTEEVLGAVGISAEQIERLRQDGAV